MKLVHICGVDGAGKSTIINQLKTIYPSSTFIKEPHNQTLIKLIKSSTDPQERAILFNKDRQLLYNEVNLTNTDQLIISDRSFLCNIVYQSLEMTDQLPIDSIHYIYNLNRYIPHPTLTIYITATPYIIANRINSRPNEKSPTYHTIKQIQNRYELVFTLLNITPLIIDTSNTPISSNLKTIINSINNITGTHAAGSPLLRCGRNAA